MTERIQFDPKQRPRILVVDDNRDVCEMILELFESERFDVVASSSFPEAVRELEARPPDAIVTDLVLRDGDGLELLRLARDRDAEALVVLVTGHASVRTAIDALRDGAYDYMEKPFDIDALVRVVERGLESRRLLRENRRLVADLTRANAALVRHEEALTDEVQKATRRLRDLLDVGREVTTHLDMAKTLDVIVDRARTLVKGSSGYLYSLRTSTGELHGESAAPRGEWPAEVPRSLLDGFPYEALTTGRPRRHAGDPGNDPFLSALSTGSALAVPLSFEEAMAGVLVVVRSGRIAFDPEDEEQLSLFALQAANAVGNAAVHGRLKEVERLKSDFVAMVSHELRTPITAIQGVFDLLEGCASDDAATREELVEVGALNARRLLSIVTDILDFSRLEASSLPMSFAPASVPQVIEAVVRSMKPIARDAEIRLETFFAHEIPAVRADRVRVEQVLTNLISNAIKFSSPGGRVSVAARREGRVVWISVTDEGCGIDAADIPRLFTKLNQLDMGASRSAGGAGLGLVISRAIVEAHGGDIVVTSEKGRGSVFEFALPIDGDAPESEARTAQGIEQVGRPRVARSPENT